MSGDESAVVRARLHSVPAGRNARARFSLTRAAFDERVARLPHQVAAAHLDDLYLAMSCADGDEAAWRECVTAHRGFLIQFAARLIGAVSAPDLVDQVIADLWERRRLARYEARSSLRTWLAAVVAHAALNERRRVARTVETPAPAIAVQPSMPGRERELSRVLQEAIASLPPPLRLLVLLYYEQGLTLEEAGRVLGRSKSRLSRTLKRAYGLICERADVIARARLGRPLAALRDDAALDALDLDLRAACADDRNEPARDVSKGRTATEDDA